MYYYSVTSCFLRKKFLGVDGVLSGGLIYLFQREILCGEDGGEDAGLSEE